MTTAILQTPFEVLLFFASLTIHGVKQENFQKISADLKSNECVRDSEGFDEARLSPESLQHLYLTLLKDEVWESREKRPASPAGQENGSPGSKKRKASSPKLQSLSDAQEHEHLLPVLVDKLYARFRQQTIESIVQDEEIFRKLDVDAGELRSAAATELVNGQEPVNETEASSLPTLRPSDSTNMGQALQIQSPSQPLASQASAIDDRLQSEPQGQALAQATASAPSKSPGPGVDSLKRPDLTASNIQQPDSPGPYSARNPLAPSPSTQRTDGQQPSLPSLASQPSPAPGLALRAPAPAPVPLTGSPRPAQTGGVAGDQSSQSPVILPPPPGVGRPHATPSGSLTPGQLRPGQAVPGPALGSQQPVSKVPGPPRAGQLHHYQDQRTSYSPQYPPFPQTTQPFSGTPQPVTQYSQPMPPHPYGQAQGMPVHGQQSPAPFQYGVVPGQQSYPGTPHQTQFPQAKPPPQATPAPSTSQRRKQLTVDTSVSSTKWKSTGRAREKSPVRPPLSPMMAELTMLSPESEVATVKPTSAKDPESIRGTPAEADETPSRPPAGRGRGRRGRGGGRGAAAAAAATGPARAGSMAASNRTRSQSTTPQLGDRSANKKTEEASAVKTERGSQTEDAQLPSAEASAATPLPMSARPRRDTLRSIETPSGSIIRPGQKRKRANTLDVGSPASTGPATPRHQGIPSRPGHVLGVKNLPRIASTLLNDVTTHKLASMFQKPISEREAPGYRDLIFRPSDLKTIRSQLQAGQRAIAAADGATQDAGGSGGMAGGDAGTPGGSKTGSAVWLERSADVMPPKAIVNSSQLEAEICRIFANAVMFNPDPKRGVGPAFRTRAKRAEAQRQGKDPEEAEDDQEDAEVDETGSLVQDAREMFRDVETQLASWRAAERTSVGGDSGMGFDGAAKEEDDDHHPDREDEDVQETVEGRDEGRSTRRRRI